MATTNMTVGLKQSLKERLDNMVATLNEEKPWPRVNRHSLALWLLDIGLQKLEGERGAKRKK